MKQYIESFLEFLAAERRLSPNTLSAYKNDLRQFEEYLAARARGPLGNGVGHVGTNGNGPGNPAALSREAVAGFFLSLREDKGYSAATIARKMAAVKALFQYLHREGIIAQNPAAKLESPEVQKPLPRAISVDDIDRLIRQADKKTTPEGLRDRAMLHLLCATGIRVTELVSLDVADLDLADRAVRCVGRRGRARQGPLDLDELLADGLAGQLETIG